MVLEMLAADMEWTPFMRYCLLGTASNMAWHQHDFEAGLRYLYEALAISRQMNLQAQVSEDLTMLSRIFFEMDDAVRARETALEAL